MIKKENKKNRKMFIVADLVSLTYCVHIWYSDCKWSSNHNYSFYVYVALNFGSKVVLLILSKVVLVIRIDRQYDLGVKGQGHIYLTAVLRLILRASLSYFYQGCLE